MVQRAAVPTSDFGSGGVITWQRVRVRQASVVRFNNVTQAFIDCFLYSIICSLSTFFVSDYKVQVIHKRLILLGQFVQSHPVEYSDMSTNILQYLHHFYVFEFVRQHRFVQFIH